MRKRFRRWLRRRESWRWPWENGEPVSGVWLAGSAETGSGEERL